MSTCPQVGGGTSDRLVKELSARSLPRTTFPFVINKSRVGVRKRVSIQKGSETMLAFTGVDRF